MWFWFVLFVFGLGAAAPHDPVRTATSANVCPHSAELRNEIEGALGQLIKEHDYPGFAYAVTGPGGPIAMGGVGVANRTGEAPMQSDTIFQIGSVTKVFTGAQLISTEHTNGEARMLQRAPLVRQTPGRAYGLGMFVVDNYVDGVDVLWHGGDVDGYAGSLVMLPDHGIAIAYMTNIGFANGFADFQRLAIERSAALCGDLRS